MQESKLKTSKQEEKQKGKKTEVEIEEKVQEQEQQDNPLTEYKDEIKIVNFDGEHFSIDQSLVKKDEKRRQLIMRIILSSIGTLFLSLYVGGLKFTFYLIALVTIFDLSLFLAFRFLPQKYSQYLQYYLKLYFLKTIDQQLNHVRFELFKHIHGNILDISAGAGEYYKYYKVSSKDISEIVSLDLLPRGQKISNTSEHQTLRYKKIKEKEKEFTLTNITKIRSQSLEELAENKDYHGYFDSIVLGTVLCQAEDPEKFLNILDKLMKSSGRIYFNEHVRGQMGTYRQQIQDYVAYPWKIIFGGCKCNQDTMRYINSMKDWKVQNWNLYLQTCPVVNEFQVGVTAKKHPRGKKLSDKT